MIAHAHDCLPEEACGLFAGTPRDDRGLDFASLAGGADADESVARFYRCGNAAASAKLYTVEPRDQLRAERDAEDRGLEIIGVMHSHTHTDPYPSPTDVAEAPDPTWHYVIVSLRHAEPMLRSFRILEGDISEEPVLIDGE